MKMKCDQHVDDRGVVATDHGHSARKKRRTLLGACAMLVGAGTVVGLVASNHDGADTVYRNEASKSEVVDLLATTNDEDTFEAVDVDQDGRLSVQEVTNRLAVRLGVIQQGLSVFVLDSDAKNTLNELITRGFDAGAKCIAELFESGEVDVTAESFPFVYPTIRRVCEGSVLIELERVVKPSDENVAKVVQLAKQGKDESVQLGLDQDGSHLVRCILPGGLGLSVPSKEMTAYVETYQAKCTGQSSDGLVKAATSDIVGAGTDNDDKADSENHHSDNASSLTDGGNVDNNVGVGASQSENDRDSSSRVQAQRLPDRTFSQLLSDEVATPYFVLEEVMTCVSAAEQADASSGVSMEESRWYKASEGLACFEALACPFGPLDASIAGNRMAVLTSWGSEISWSVASEHFTAQFVIHLAGVDYVTEEVTDLTDANDIASLVMTYMPPSVVIVASVETNPGEDHISVRMACNYLHVSDFTISLKIDGATTDPDVMMPNELQLDVVPLATTAVALASQSVVSQDMLDPDTAPAPPFLIADPPIPDDPAATAPFPDPVPDPPFDNWLPPDSDNPEATAPFPDPVLDLPIGDFIPPGDSTNAPFPDEVPVPLLDDPVPASLKTQTLTGACATCGTKLFRCDAQSIASGACSYSSATNAFMTCLNGQLPASIFVQLLSHALVAPHDVLSELSTCIATVEQADFEAEMLEVKQTNWYDASEGLACFEVLGCPFGPLEASIASTEMSVLKSTETAMAWQIPSNHFTAQFFIVLAVDTYVTGNFTDMTDENDIAALVMAYLPPSVQLTVKVIPLPDQDAVEVDVTCRYLYAPDFLMAMNVDSDLVFPVVSAPGELKLDVVALDTTTFETVEVPPNPAPTPAPTTPVAVTPSPTSPVPALPSRPQAPILTGDCASCGLTLFGCDAQSVVSGACSYASGNTVFMTCLAAELPRSTFSALLSGSTEVPHEVLDVLMACMSGVEEVDAASSGLSLSDTNWYSASEGLSCFATKGCPFGPLDASIANNQMVQLVATPSWQVWWISSNKFTAQFVIRMAGVEYVTDAFNDQTDEKEITALAMAYLPPSAQFSIGIYPYPAENVIDMEIMVMNVYVTDFDIQILADVVIENRGLQPGQLALDVVPLATASIATLAPSQQIASTPVTPAPTSPTPVTPAPTAPNLPTGGQASGTRVLVEKCALCGVILLDCTDEELLSGSCSYSSTSSVFMTCLAAELPANTYSQLLSGALATPYDVFDALTTCFSRSSADMRELTSYRVWDGLACFDALQCPFGPLDASTTNNQMVVLSSTETAMAWWISSDHFTGARFIIGLADVGYETDEFTDLSDESDVAASVKVHLPPSVEVIVEITAFPGQNAVVVAITCKYLYVSDLQLWLTIDDALQIPIATTSSEFKLDVKTLDTSTVATLSSPTTITPSPAAPTPEPTVPGTLPPVVPAPSPPVPVVSTPDPDAPASVIPAPATSATVAPAISRVLTGVCASCGMQLFGCNAQSLASGACSYSSESNPFTTCLAAQLPATTFSQLLSGALITPHAANEALTTCMLMVQELDAASGLEMEDTNWYNASEGLACFHDLQCPFGPLDASVANDQMVVLTPAATWMAWWIESEHFTARFVIRLAGIEYVTDEFTDLADDNDVAKLAEDLLPPSAMFMVGIYPFQSDGGIEVEIGYTDLYVSDFQIALKIGDEVIASAWSTGDEFSLEVIPLDAWTLETLIPIAPKPPTPPTTPLITPAGPVTQSETHVLAGDCVACGMGLYDCTAESLASGLCSYSTSSTAFMACLATQLPATKFFQLLSHALTIPSDVHDALTTCFRAVEEVDSSPGASIDETNWYKASEGLACFEVLRCPFGPLEASIASTEMAVVVSTATTMAWWITSDHFTAQFVIRVAGRDESTDEFTDLTDENDIVALVAAHLPPSAEFTVKVTPFPTQNAVQVGITYRYLYAADLEIYLMIDGAVKSPVDSTRGGFSLDVIALDTRTFET